MPITINSQGKDQVFGTVSTVVSSTCGQDYYLVSPTIADCWTVNITLVSELSTQSIHVWIYEAIGSYPYNYDKQTNVPYARGIGKVNLFTRLDPSKKYEVWIRDAYAKQFSGTISEKWSTSYNKNIKLFSNDACIIPQVDGIINQLEWFDAYKNQIRFTGIENINLVELYAKNDDENLYLAFKFNDPRHDNLMILSFADGFGNLVSKHSRWDQGTWDLFFNGSYWDNATQTEAVAKWGFYNSTVQVVEWKIPLNSRIEHDVVLETGKLVGLGIRYGLDVPKRFPDNYDYQQSNTWAALNLVISSIVKNGDFEGPVLYSPWTILGWGDGGILGPSSPGDTRFGKKALFLYQWDKGSEIWQTISLDTSNATLFFWYRPNPVGYDVALRLKFDGNILFERKFFGSNSEYGWTHVGIPLKPIFDKYKLTSGNHEIRFTVLKGDSQQYFEHGKSPNVGIDNVTVTLNSISEKSKTTTTMEAIQNYPRDSNIKVKANVTIPQNTVQIDFINHVELVLQYSIDNGKNWIDSVKHSINTTKIEFTWPSPIIGSYIVRMHYLGDNWHEPSYSLTSTITVGSNIQVDKILVSEPRANVKSNQTISFHLIWEHNKTAAKNIPVHVKNHVVKSNSEGWATFTVTNDFIGMVTWVISSIDECDKYTLIASNPAIIWDQVGINVENGLRCNIDKPELNWVGEYLYDRQIFKGTISLNDTLSKIQVGKYPYKVVSISDYLYGLTKFVSNEFTVILDRVNIMLTVTKNRIDVGKKPEVKIEGVYEYDSQPFTGTVTIAYPDSYKVGSFKVALKSINDPLYNLTKFKSNELNVVFDQIKIAESGTSAKTVDVKQPITVWYKAVYEYDNEAFDGSKGTLYVNNEAYTWSQANQRWEKQYTFNDPSTLSLKISSIKDEKYGLTAFKAYPPIDIEWKQAGIPGYYLESVFLGLLISLLILIYVRKNSINIVKTYPHNSLN